MQSAEIAQAVADVIDAATLSRPVQAVRAWLPIYELGEMDQLRVTVVPTTRAVHASTRVFRAIDHRIEVAVQMRVAPEQVAAVDDLVGLSQEIAVLLTARELPSLPGVLWIGTHYEALAATEHLNELRQYTGLLALTYRSWEAA